LPGGKRRGINLVKWYMRLKPPKTAPAKTLAAGALFGPMVPEGTYTYKLRKGDSTYSGEITLQVDRTLPHSAADRRLQQEAVLELYQLQERLAYVATAVADAGEQAHTRADSLKEGDDLKKTLVGFAEKLEELHGTLVVAERKKGITGEKQLRERIVDLYAAVNGFGGRPSETQLTQMTILEKQVEEADVEFRSIAEEQLNKINSRLEKKKLAPLKLLSEEEFRRRDN
jgi:hypothetical protein